MNGDEFASTVIINLMEKTSDIENLAKRVYNKKDVNTSEIGRTYKCIYNLVGLGRVKPTMSSGYLRFEWDKENNGGR